MARLPKHEDAPGIYRKPDRNGKPAGNYHLRYSVNGEQVRRSLGTKDFAEAVVLAEGLRGRPVAAKSGKVIGGRSVMENELDKYQQRIVAAARSDRKSQRAARTYAENYGYAVRSFVTIMKIDDPAKITTGILKTYYEKAKALKSVATIQTYTSRVGTFARDLGYRVDTPKFAEAPPSRDVVIEPEKVSNLINGTNDNELKFILFCGFLGGMRREEIDMARPAWFDFTRGRINIPHPDPITGYFPKSGRKRSIPLVPAFAEWIQETFPDWGKMAFCVRPEKQRGKAKYRYDFRSKFETYAKHNCPELTCHVMRHSFATAHANNPTVSIAQLSEWTGDRIATLEKHYLHMTTDAVKAAASFEFVLTKPEDDTNEPHPGKLRMRQFEYLE